MSRPHISGRKSLLIALGVGGLGLVAATLAYAAFGKAAPLAVPGGEFRFVDRALTGHQRAERVAFFENGTSLVVACPRYGHLVAYDVKGGLVPRWDRKLRGKPVAVCAGAGAGALWTLQRPAGDARHLEPGFLQRLDVSGNEIGAAIPVGFDPDDFLLLPDQNVAVILLSGNREGETNRPDPSLLFLDVSDPNAPRTLAELTLGVDAGDDPTRLAISERATHLAVLTFKGQLIGVDLRAPSRPVETGRLDLAARDRPQWSYHEGDSMIVFDRDGGPVVGLRGGSEGLLVSLSGGAVRVHAALSGRELGTIGLRGPGGFGVEHGMSLAYSTETEMLAISDRAGGVHLVHFRSTDETNSGGVGTQ